jgi:ubiquinone/menaquinone biosynthesis C-methylase UbiE
METDPERMDKLSKGAFKNIYPLIANQIIERCAIKDGICIDIGSGNGALASSIARITDLNIYSLDISDRMNEIANENIEKERLNHRIFPVIGDVHQLPFSDDFADLIISRGSMFFWEDKKRSFKEIHRVLKYDGCAYIGGGFGSAELKDKIKPSLNNDKSDKINIPRINVKEIKSILNQIPIENYQIISDNSGLWILFKKDKK